MTAPPAVAFSHMGFYVVDLAAMEGFYKRVFGFVVTDRGHIRGADIVFLTRSPQEHHQLVLQAGRPDTLSFNNLQQLSLRVESLADLRALYRTLEGEPVSGLHAVTHGSAWCLYFHDPEGNRIEVFLYTPWYVRQPVYEALDLSRTDEAIQAWTEERFSGALIPRAEWRASIAEKLARQRAQAAV